MDTIEANGITLAYGAWGPGTAPPVLLLHCCRGADGADWTRITERLAEGPRPRRVYAPDLARARAQRPARHGTGCRTRGVRVRGDAQRNAPDPVWWDHMGRITMPTLLIGAGPTSPIPQGQVTAFAGPLPDVRLATVGGGHPVHETRPKEFLAAMEAFLAA